MTDSPIARSIRARLLNMSNGDNKRFQLLVAEKFQTMIARGRFNSRMKDFFDLYRIFKVHKFDSELLERAIAATFKNRGTQFV